MRPLLLATLVLVSGCDLVAAYDRAPPVGVADSADVSDGRALVDAYPDGVEETSPDVRVDVNAADTSPALDAGPRDAEPDAAEPTPCAPGLAVAKSFASAVRGQLAFCEGIDTTVKYDQCSAEALCNTLAGWRLCEASRYQQLVTVAPPQSFWAWIAGCIRDGADVHAPSDGICQCVAAAAPDSAVGWGCGASPTTMASTKAHMGLLSYDRCRQVGLQSATTESYWLPQSADFITARAVCCKP